MELEPEMALDTHKVLNADFLFLMTSRQRVTAAVNY
jgi:hypothetical protein